MAVYFYYGEEEFSIEQEINKLKKGLDKDFLEMSFHVYYNPDFGELMNILRTQPMMFGKKLEVIKCYKYFKESFADNELKQIEDALQNISDNIDIVFVAELPRKDDAKIDKRRKIFNILNKHNAKEFPAVASYKTAELETWIKKQSKEKDITLDNDAMRTLITQVGTNLRELDGELEKLKLFIYPKKQVTSEDIHKFCIVNENLFAFTDYLLARQTDKALIEYRKLLQSSVPLKILATLQTMLRKWILLKAKASKCSVTELSRLTGKHEYVVKLDLQKLKNVDLKYLVKLKQNLTEAEYQIKTGQILDVEAEVENVLFR